MFTSREGDNNFSDSKYVADILSSMANGEPATPTYSISGYLSGVTTATTPTLTPTTLASIERTFIELQSVPVSQPGQDPLTQSGFVPPIVDPVSQEHSLDGQSDSNSDQEWTSGSKRPFSATSGSDGGPGSPSYGSGSTRKRRRYDDKNLSSEELERRQVRRERNKLAAAKCRQRRVDHTNQLVDETDKLEAERTNLESEIQSLQQQKDQLEFILQAHQPLCKVDSAINMSNKPDTIKVKPEPLPAHSNCVSFRSDSKFSAPNSARPNSLAIKQEKREPATSVAGVPISTPSNGLFPFESLVDGSTGLTPVSTSCASQVHRGSSESSSHLAIKHEKRESASSVAGVSISTPSNGLFPFESLVDGSTGLTPVSTSCASQAHRSSSESGSEAVGSPTLISL